MNAVCFLALSFRKKPEVFPSEITRKLKKVFIFLSDACVFRVLITTDLFQIIAFSDEEGIRFQTTFLGSSAIAGTFQPKHLKNVDARCGLNLTCSCDPLWRFIYLLIYYFICGHSDLSFQISTENFSAMKMTPLSLLLISVDQKVLFECRLTLGRFYRFGESLWRC